MVVEDKKIGRQTPTKSFVLPYEKTLAQEAIALYEKSGNHALEWQKLLLNDIMAINEDGLWTHMTVGYSVPRRNGKTESVYMRESWGLEHGEQIVHTAHRTSTSHSSWEKMKRILEKSGYEEDEDFTSIKATGREELTLLMTGGRILYRTRTNAGGLGEGFDLLVIDEAQEYTDSQQSALGYTVSSSQNPQTIMCGTPPTAVSKGTVFEPYRKACLSGKSTEDMWAEWSIDKQAEDRSDPDLWRQTNPSLGLILPERNVRSELAKMEEVDFNIQRLGLWLAYNQASAILETDWNPLQIDTDNPPTFTGRLFAGIKYGKDNHNVAVSIAIRTTDKRVFVETLDCRPIAQGNGWIIDFLKSADVEKIVIDGANGQSLLVQEMKDFGVRKKPVLPKVIEVIEANASFTQAISSKTVCHAGQPSLKNAVCNCDTRTVQSNGGFGYKSQKDDIDISLLDSAILAYWACSKAKTGAKQRISY